MTETAEDGRSAPSSTLHRIEDGILFLLMGALVILSCAQILLRNWFDISFLWVDPATRHLVLLMRCFDYSSQGARGLQLSWVI